MKKCNECRNEFEKATQIHWRYGTFYECPECSSQNISEIPEEIEDKNIVDCNACGHFVGACCTVGGKCPYNKFDK
jgi:DNA-directed RNA polymerase subunit RPC12/RpoP